MRCIAGSTRRGLTRGEESEEGGDSVPLRQDGREGPLHFSMFLGGLKIDAKMVPKKLPKLSSKGTPKVSQNHQNGLQKPSQNRVPKKHRKMMIFSTLQCGSCIVNNSKIDDFQVLILTPFWVSFWRCFGSPNGGQGHQKAISKHINVTTSQTLKGSDPKMVKPFNR